MVAAVTSPPESRFRAVDVYLKLLADAGLALADAEEAAGAGENGQAGEAIDRVGRGAHRPARRVGRDVAAANARSSGRTAAPMRARLDRLRARAAEAGRPQRRRAGARPGRGDRPGARCVAGVAGRRAPFALARATGAAGFLRAPSAARSRRAPRRGSPRPRSSPSPTSRCARTRSPAGRPAARARCRGSRRATRRRRPRRSSATSWRCRTTARIAVPSDPPTRWSTLSIGVARGTWSRSIVAYAAAIAGIIVKPRPRPRSDERGAEEPERRVAARPG